MTHTAKLFYDINEPFAAGFFEIENASPAKMFCRAYRRYMETAPVPTYKSFDPLYPYRGLGNDRYAVNPQYCRQYYADFDRLRAKSEECEKLFRQFDAEHGDFLNVEGREAGSRYAGYIDAWNHSALNFKRIVAEGFNKYEERVRAMKDDDLREALLDLMIGIRTYHARMIEHLESAGAPEKLVTALKKVPFSPAETAYEAIVSCNFALCLDGCDDIGFIDGWLPKYWKGEDYLGLGLSAHSYFEGVRFANSRDIDGYISGRDIVCERAEITPSERMTEYVMLRMRMSEGVDSEEFEREFGISFDEVYGEKLSRYEKDGYIVRNCRKTAFSDKGFFVSNFILSDILDF